MSIKVNLNEQTTLDLDDEGHAVVVLNGVLHTSKTKYKIGDDVKIIFVPNGEVIFADDHDK